VLAIAAAGVVLGAAALVLGGAALVRARRLERRYTLLMRGVAGEDLAAALDAFVTRLNAADDRLKGAESALLRLEDKLGRAVQQVAVLRYRAFEDAGGDQSFTVALLDAHRDGVVLSGLHARGGVRVYAKPVQGGRSSYSLTTEEEQAVQTAGARGGTD
jgi:hypothetical protein